MGDLFEVMTEQVKREYPSIVFPEGEDERIIQAAARLSTEEILKPIMIGSPENIRKQAEMLGVSLDHVVIHDPQSYDAFPEMVRAFAQRRNGKETEASAEEKLHTPNYFGTMLVYLGLADGLVSGAAHSTGDTVRPALQIIKTKPGIQKTSGVFIMVKEEEKLVFADCAINISPSAGDLAEIAIATADTAQAFDIDPKIAMLSFSTKGSAQSPETEKAADATATVQQERPDLLIDGEFQFDAAYVPEVAAKKAPDSPLKGEANVFIFPSLESGNIGYKLVQRLGGYDAVGPILQGLNKPVNDLSRGCSTEDVYKLALITAKQAITNKTN
ncbi:phosphate acetyltransferase [Bacillus piscicola]|uniref:phosphate acetyltransferase n=1 Tax=Bacillus piscicola TaxID=1632684 RepID=UPI001F09C305|nr:phosphate acetyltransferase [Bacillus piscicola]